MMQMSDHELLYEYNHAVNRKAQIGILADLNAVSQEEMHQKLVSLGAVDLPALDDLPKLPYAGKTSRIDDKKAMELYNAGAGDDDIAAAFGVGRKAIFDWRQKHNLKINRKKPESIVAANKKSVGIEGIYRIARHVLEQYPDAVVSVDGRKIRNVTVRFKYSENGDICGAEMALVLEEANA